MRKFLILVCLIVPAAPALAGTWIAPAGCEVFMTVQSKACRVSHYYRCEADPAGDQWRVDLDQEGPFFYSRIDAEGQWIESYDPMRQTLDPSPVDPASYSELIAEGMDTWDFGLTKEDGTGSRASGYDRLTGKTVVLTGGWDAIVDRLGSFVLHRKGREDLIAAVLAARPQEVTA
mgnify:CR=1 FL=1